MQTVTVSLDRSKALALWRDYKTHQHYETPIDEEIRRAYWLIAKGKTVIRAIESIKAAGADDQGRPKLAIARATATHCFCDAELSGNVRFNWLMPKQKLGWATSRNEIAIRGFGPARHMWNRHKAIVPIIPIHLRPKRALENYHILWEADWHAVPRDPFLLRRIGRSDLWLVCAAWDLTEVEQAVLQSRVMA